MTTQESQIIDQCHNKLITSILRKSKCGEITINAVEDPLCTLRLDELFRIMTAFKLNIIQFRTK
jgi:hypothetical protein